MSLLFSFAHLFSFKWLVWNKRFIIVFYERVILFAHAYVHPIEEARIAYDFDWDKFIGMFDSVAINFNVAARLPGGVSFLDYFHREAREKKKITQQNKPTQIWGVLFYILN